jgi:hydrogenase expression/formation protein HypD
MKYVDECRSDDLVRRQAEALSRITTRAWTIMEICGGQTHAIVRHSLEQMLPEGITLLHGPGCPVCVTPGATIDQAIAVACRSDVIFCSFGDMMRVPGATDSLLAAKAKGADVRMVYSPLDALAIASREPDRQVVFFAIGFETTAPTTAMAVLQAEQADIANFSLLVSHVLVPPAIEALLADCENPIDGFLAAGHVCTVMGIEQYGPIAHRFRVPIVVTGFEPLDLLQGIYLCVRQLEAGQARVENQYARSVRPEGNQVAREVLEQVFVVRDQEWRGLGSIPASGFQLAPRYARFDARQRFPAETPDWDYDKSCLSGEVLRGRRKPTDCPAFGTSCSPVHPLGATMVSSEGACAAYFRYRRAGSA